MNFNDYEYVRLLREDPDLSNYQFLGKKSEFIKTLEESLNNVCPIVECHQFGFSRDGGESVELKGEYLTDYKRDLAWDFFKEFYPTNLSAEASRDWYYFCYGLTGSDSDQLANAEKLFTELLNIILEGA